MFEHRRQPLLSRVAFLMRMARSAGIAIGVVLVGLGLGVLGYHYLDDLPWIDALVNAAMILSGMGPVDPLHNTGGKLFAAMYALLSGFLFLSVAGILLVPVLHRMMHRFHVETDEAPKADDALGGQGN
jgi:flagellar biosynthesis protein FliR